MLRQQRCNSISEEQGFWEYRVLVLTGSHTGLHEIGTFLNLNINFFICKIRILPIYLKRLHENGFIKCKVPHNLRCYEYST